MADEQQKSNEIEKKQPSTRRQAKKKWRVRASCAACLWRQDVTGTGERPKVSAPAGVHCPRCEQRKGEKNIMTVVFAYKDKAE